MSSLSNTFHPARSFPLTQSDKNAHYKQHIRAWYKRYLAQRSILSMDRVVLKAGKTSTRATLQHNARHYAAGKQ